MGNVETAWWAYYSAWMTTNSDLRVVEALRLEWRRLKREAATPSTPDTGQGEKNDMTDLEMMQSPQLWPYHPLLALKRRGPLGEYPEFGVLVAENDASAPVVHKIGIGQGVVTPRGNWGAIARQEFDSFAALLAAGWIVD